MKGVSRGPRGVRRASAAHSRTHSVWLSAGARFAAQPRAVPIDALGGGACFPGLSSVRVRFILLTYLLRYDVGRSVGRVRVVGQEPDSRLMLPPIGLVR